MNLLPTSYLTELIVRMLAMISVASPVGCFRAWFARFMGDPTAEEQGYLTLNPFQHVPLIGFIMLLFFPFGIINVTPINPANYHNPHRRLKIGAVAFSGVISYFLLAVIALIGLTVIWGPQLVPQHGSLTWAYIFIIFIQTCTFYAILEFFMYSVLLLAMPLIEEQLFPPHYIYIGLIVLPLILILAFGDTIQHVLGYGIVSLAQFLVNLFGGV